MANEGAGQREERGEREPGRKREQREGESPGRDGDLERCDGEGGRSLELTPYEHFSAQKGQRVFYEIKIDLRGSLYNHFGPMTQFKIKMK